MRKEKDAICTYLCTCDAETLRHGVIRMRRTNCRHIRRHEQVKQHDGRHVPFVCPSDNCRDCDRPFRVRSEITICDAMFNIQQFYVLLTQCIYVFCVDLRTNSDYLPIQH